MAVWINLPRGSTPQSQARTLAALSQKINGAIDAAIVEAVSQASGTSVMAIVYMTSNTSVATATYATIAYDGEIRDTDGWHSNVTNNTRITVVDAGVYEVVGMVTWDNGTTSTPCYYKLLVNGSETMRWEFPTNGAAARAGHSFSGYADLTAGQYIEISAQHGESGPLNLVGGSGKTWLKVRYLGA
jgi:hypothetical protein